MNQPIVGQKSFMTFVLFVIIAALCCACQQKPGGDQKDKEPSWSLRPVLIEFTDSRGLSATKKITVFTPQTGPIGDLEPGQQQPLVRFAEQDNGLLAEVKSTCASGGQTTTATRLLTTQSHHSLKTLVPVSLYKLSSVRRLWNCRFDWTVIHPKGNRHRFSIAEVQFRSIVYSEGQIEVSLGATQANTSTPKETLTLVCPDWFATEKVAVNQPLASRLEILARSQTVTGTDTRMWSRRPLCSAVIDSDHVRFLSLYQPQLKVPGVSIQRGTPLKAATGYDLRYSTVILNWKITNTNPYPVRYHVRNFDLKIQVATDNQIDVRAGGANIVGWDKEWWMQGRLEIRAPRVDTNDKGHWFWLGPNQVADFSLSVAREMLCIVNFARDHIQAISFRLDRPLYLHTLSGSSVRNQDTWTDLSQREGSQSLDSYAGPDLSEANVTEQQQFFDINTTGESLILKEAVLVVAPNGHLAFSNQTIAEHRSVRPSRPGPTSCGLGEGSNFRHAD